ncbi:MAG TPA: hypothetical protein VFN48_04955 [Solirubrobacteraceae bacterium]|nr:hypothetical protein [Solirubrobacteraceae bacterium]
MDDPRSGFRIDRLRLGEWVIGLGAVGLLVDLIAVPWYSLRATFRATSAEFGAATSATGIQAHHLLGALAILCSLLGLLAWGLQATQRGPAAPLSATVMLFLLCLPLCVGLLIRVVFDPPAVIVLGAPGVNTIQTDVGAVVGLFLAWGLLLGTWVSMRTDGIAVADAPREIETLRLARRPD